MDSADANAARLILAVLDDPAWKDDLPRMVVGSLARQRNGAWLTTTANLWGSLALDKFSAKFESTPVAGTTTAALSSSGAPKGGSAASAPAPRTVADVVAPGQRRGDADSTGRRARRRSTSSRKAAGKPWLTVQSLAAIPLKAPLRAGYAVTRSVSAVEQKDKGSWSRGDVVKVRLEIDAQSDMTWVVVSDPVPGGATILGGGLGRDSQIATRGEQRSGSAWPAFEERSFEAFRALLRVPAARQARGRVHGAPEQSGPVRAAADARRGDVRAGELRRVAESGHRGRAVMRVAAFDRSARGRSRSSRRAALAAIALFAVCTATQALPIVRRGQGRASPVRPHARRSPRHADPDRSRRQVGAAPGVDADRRDVAGAC